MIQSELYVETWQRRDPSAGEVRPDCCVGCHLRHGIDGGRIDGHGRRKRRCQGPLRLGAKAEVTSILARRYQCQRCDCIMIVVPREIAGRFVYTLRAMLLALAYWGLEGESGGAVRERISPEPARGFHEPRLWPSLRRWVMKRAELWPAVHVAPRATLRATAKALVVALCARLVRAPPVPAVGDAWQAAVCA